MGDVKNRDRIKRAGSRIVSCTNWGCYWRRGCYFAGMADYECPVITGRVTGPTDNYEKLFGETR